MTIRKLLSLIALIAALLAARCFAWAEGAAIRAGELRLVDLSQGAQAFSFTPEADSAWDVCAFPSEGFEDVEAKTAENTGICFTIAVNYGGRDEIVRAVRKLAGEAAGGTLAPEAIDEAMISAALDTAGMPDPDLLIRTGGEQRLSNFLLWQSAYTEFYYTDKYWPDFDLDELKRAVAWYSGRQRRFGGVKK